MAVPYDFSKEVGRIFGDLTFIRFSHRQHYHPYIVCLCNCGNETIASWDNVKAGRTRSCGCKKGFQTNYTKHPLYKVWCSMRQRCNNPNDDAYGSYGGRGVKVCDEWNDSFEPFAKWAESNGWKPGLEIDKDSKGNGLLYSPETCACITHRQNMRVRRNVKLTQAQADEIKVSTESNDVLSQKYGVHKNNIRSIKAGKQWA